MICAYCSSYQVTPVISFIKPENHKHIKLKNNRVLHIVHLNGEKTGAKLDRVYLKQPEKAKKPSHENVENLEKPAKNDLLKQTNEIDEKINKKSDDTQKIFIDNFTKLVDSNKFKTKKLNGLFYLTSQDENYKFKIIFKKKINVHNETIKNDIINDNSSVDYLSLPNLRNEKPLPLLFYIHGVGGNSNIWLKQLEFFFMRGYEIITVDLLGHGESSTSLEDNCYLFSEMALDVLSVFDQFSKSENVLIGHSYGCSFSTFLAQTRRDLIIKVILISGGSPHPLDYKNPLLSAPSCFIGLIQPLINCHFYCSAFNSIFKLPSNSSEAFKISSHVLQKTMKGQVWKSASEDYHRTLHQPVLLIEGEFDKFVPFDDALDMLKVVRHGYLVVIDQGSHMVIMEQPDLINNLISLFLNDNFTYD